MLRRPIGCLMPAPAETAAAVRQRLLNLCTCRCCKYLFGLAALCWPVCPCITSFGSWFTAKWLTLRKDACRCPSGCNADWNISL